MIGSIVYATEQGLGRLAKGFYDHGVVSKVMVRPHKTRENHYDWYEERSTDIDEFFDGLTALLLFETAHYDWVYSEAKKRGVRTVLMPMYECTSPAEVAQADIVIAPSSMELRYYPQAIPIAVPVEVKWRKRERAHHFIHNAGFGGLGGRNGTKELLDAIPLIKSPIKMTIRQQEEIIKGVDDERVELVTGTVPYEDLWKTGDVFVFPEKFNGLSLPIQEAFASGMLVMASDRPVNATFLPQDPFIPVAGYTEEQIAVKFDCAVITSADIAKTIDEWYDVDISVYSQYGREFGKAFTWENLAPKYFDLCLH